MCSPLAAIRALWGHREQPKQSEPTLLPDRTRIAVLENQLLGITPQPGTPEAMAVAQATPVDRSKCPHEDVIEVTGLGDARRQGMCQRCGASMAEGDEGTWCTI